MKSKKSRCNLRHFFTSIIISCVCTTALPQSSFKEIDDEVRSWYAQIVDPTSLTSTKAPKTIDYSAQNYLVTGIISKGVLCEGTIAKFYDTTSPIPKLLLEGKVSYDADRLVVKGIKYGNASDETNKTYGSFYAYNMDDFSMNYKAKKAGVLRIKCSKASYLEGFYLQCPVIVKLNDKKSMVYVDGETGGRGYSFLSAQIPDITLNDDESFDMNQILLCAKDNVTMCWKDGAVFKGNVKPKKNKDKTILFNTLDGQYTGLKSGPKKKSVSHMNGDIIYSQEDNDDNPVMLKEILYIKDNGTISEDDLWNLDKIIEKCYLAKWTFRNGNYFEGTIKSIITYDDSTQTSTISSNPVSGIFKYPNGDRFEGELTRHAGSLYVDGTTFFADGTKFVGNWMEKYKLTKEQWEKVNSSPNPSEARNLIEKLVYSNNYQDYKYSDGIIYFMPEPILDTGYFRTSSSKITYDKTNKYFTCDGRLRFAVDKNGYRKWDIVYDNNNPKYLNEYTWYVNGVIESIKSYHYDTKEIYVICHFFTDGKLRSAYQYGRGNNGKNVLRLSKESHPTFGGYTCKQYDLNGQYERSVSWKIGEEPYGLFVYQFAPNRLISDKLEPIY